MLRGKQWGLIAGLLGAIACGRGAGAESASIAEEEQAPAVGTESGGASSGGAPGISAGGAGGAAQQPDDFMIEGVTWLDGQSLDLIVHGGVVRARSGEGRSPTVSIDGTGLVAFPAFVDSHVHLTYYDVSQQLAALGVLAAVDLAAPIETLKSSSPDLELIRSGPMVTSLLGYPTQGWGRDGYGLETSNVEEARAGVATLVAAGARIIKVPLDGDNSLTDAQVSAVTSAAHEAGLKVAAHALTAIAALRGAELGCDLLAHTPTEPLGDDVIAAWADKAVVSTLKAFGAGVDARDNLARLHTGGTKVLYGTDLGNLRTVGVDVGELRLLEEVGLSREESLAALALTPSVYWGLEVGQLRLGGPAHFVLLEGDPTENLDVLLKPRVVVYQGRLVVSPTDQ